MGLDMYLQARRSAYDGTHIKDPEAAILVEAADRLGFPKDRESGYELTVDIGYWRKANGVHQWFVERCADGVDDCKPVYVSHEQLGELKAICERIIAECPLVEGIVRNGYQSTGTGGMQPITERGKVMTNQELAAELLPTQGGFFFGSTDYDQWYYEDLQSTVEILDRALALDPKHFDIRYRASW